MAKIALNKKVENLVCKENDLSETIKAAIACLHACGEYAMPAGTISHLYDALESAKSALKIVDGGNAD